MSPKHIFLAGRKRFVAGNTKKKFARAFIIDLTLNVPVNFD